MKYNSKFINYGIKHNIYKIYVTELKVKVEN